MSIVSVIRSDTLRASQSNKEVDRMSETQSSFSAVNSDFSRLIYKTFCSKSVINKKIYRESSASFVESELHHELIKNLSHYELLYSHIGYKLTHDSQGEYFYIKSLGEVDEFDEGFDETSLKIMAILSLIAKIATNRQQSLATLGEPVQGITSSDLELIDNDHEMLNIVRALKFKNAFEALELLKRTGFAFKVFSNRHVLSKGAMVMIDSLIDHYKSN